MKHPAATAVPIVDKKDKVGYNAVECWGGATFDACLRFLKEDPWDRLRKLRDGFKNFLAFFAAGVVKTFSAIG